MVFLYGVHVPRVQRLSLIALVIFATAPVEATKEIDTAINPEGCGRSEPVGKIYNGEPISRDYLPWMVQLFTPYNLTHGHACGGSIITSNVILTAAHCLVEDGVFPEKVIVLFNSTGYLKGLAVLAEKIMVHPRFLKGSEIVYDVALVKLTRDLEFNRIMKPVCLPEEDIHVAEKTLIFAGWGQTESARTSTTLLHAEIVGLTDEFCQAVLRIIQNPITKQRVKRGPMICAMGPSTNVCEGDSGGPLILKDDEGRTTQVGIASLGVHCAPNLPAMFSRVAFQMKWIKQMLNRPARWRKLKFDRHIHNLTPNARSSVSMRWMTN